MTFIRTNPARLYSIVTAALPLAVYYGLDLPIEIVIPLAAALLGLGEVVQRTEDRKTTDALYAPSPEHEVMPVIGYLGLVDGDQDDESTEAKNA
ncbi:hypothetical protein [Embleya hyalina]|uniref:Uncharacterized protein n=1 Tax=Embleya hyalina TaxID=516124 RepID=A0A401YZ13_9ACTN|nr:hypothetical protein [Embleya hyalina]GCD99874.1 hypothetical protein EHYA_07596 [Embleya hyalina]